VKTHVVTVGSATNASLLRFVPDTVTADVGDMIQFQFANGNHTVTQSTFDNPCQPIAMHSNVTGFFSGFQPVAAAKNLTGMVPVVTMPVNVATPMWFYCSQGKHCEAGMVLVVNEK
jgi:plastocyanin